LCYCVLDKNDSKLTPRGPVVRFNEEGVVLEFNDTGCTLFGYKDGDVVGKHVSLLIPELDGQQKFALNKRTTNARRKDNTLFPIDLHLTQQSDSSYVALLLDLSKLKASEVSDETLAAVFDSAVDPLIIINTSGVIQRANAATVKLFGYSHSIVLFLLPH
jgi:two-component system sensor kinase FixL